MALVITLKMRKSPSIERHKSSQNHVATAASAVRQAQRGGPMFAA
jgi:hypothetical protein